MSMDKIIKEFKIEYSNNERLIYRLGYILRRKKIYLKIEIYRNGILLSNGSYTFGGSLNFHVTYYSSISIGSFGTIKEMFIKLRQYSNIPDNIEREYESLFILYKLNNFKEF